MADISQTVIANAFCWIKILYILIQILLRFVTWDPSDNQLA